MIRRLIDNIGWKVLSLAIAFALWATYVAESDVRTSIAAPLQFRNVPRELEISSDVPDRMDLKVRGPSDKLTSSSLAEVNITLDLSTVTRPGEQTFAINTAAVHLPEGVVLERVVPAQLRLSFERRASREIPVQVKLGEPPPAGYQIAWQQVRPEKVRITGPESLVRRIESAQTDAVNLNNTVGVAEFRVPAFVSDPHVRLEQDAPVVVRVQVEKSAK